MLTPVECESQVFQIGFIVFPVTLIMCIGVLIGTPLGIKSSKIISSKMLRILFSILMIVVIIKKIYELAASLGYL